jgi:pilus assembly protein CpaF
MNSIFQAKRRSNAESVAVERSAEPQASRNGAQLCSVSDNELDWLYRLHEKLLDIMDLSLVTSLPEREARTQIRDTARHLINEESVPLSAAVRQRLVTQLENEILGLGPLETLMADKSVADILVNGYQSVYVERHGKLESTDVRFRDNQHLMNIIDRIVSNVGRRIDESSPMVDARLQDGSRVNVIIPPLALDGPVLSIRRFAIERLAVEDLVTNDSLTETVAQLLRGIVKSRLNVLISGGTGSGKTTLLNIVSGFISPDERIVTIEDSAELQLQQPHVARLETRPPNIEGKGEVAQRDLVRNSLRMRPDRIVVGEVRGAEALDMLQAMNTGHDGSLTTIHANTPRDALTRIETMVTMAGLNLPVRSTRAQIASAIDVVVQLERMEDGKRRLISLQEIQGMEGDIITMAEIFRYQRQGIDAEGRVRGQFEATGIVPKFNDHLRQRGIELDFDIFSPGASL